MIPEKLNPQQHLSLNKSIQAALDRSAASLQMMLSGEVHIELCPPALRAPDVCVSLGLTGALPGGIYIDLPETMAIQIVKTLIPGSHLTLLDEMSRSVLMELGNILASVFVAYFDQSRGLRTLPTPPELCLIPLDIPRYAECLSADFSWTKSHDRAQVLIGLDRSALNILLAG